ncbi:ABC transporter ATP-binding protein [Taibaiella sp. KBW10]|nr:ABC transporter ATP-binding protein [Taibaiella sp. KBW10]
MEYAINITNLYKKYPHAEFNSVDGLNLQFPKGKISGLLGPNGAGKTTTISIMCGLVAADSGSVKVLGLDAQTDIHKILQKTGIVTQHVALYPLLSAWENLVYIGGLYNIPQKALHDKISFLLERFGLQNSAKKQVKHFSGGMKRRCNIIASLLHDPELLILDEPTAGVDIHSRAMILDFLSAYNEEGHTILYTSHLLDEAERLCTEVAIIDDGKQVVQGSIQDLKAQVAGVNTLEELFLHYTGRSLRE